MDLRQFVGPGGEKGSESRSANPILNMVDMFTSDKAQHMVRILFTSLFVFFFLNIHSLDQQYEFENARITSNNFSSTV